VTSDQYSSDPTVSSEIREKANRAGKRIGKQAFKHVKSKAKNTEVASIIAVNERAQTIFDGLRTEGNQGDVKQSDRECEPGKV
jgi:hypothetical protein